MPGQGGMKSVEAHRFAMTPKTSVPRSVFDTSWYNKFTFNVTHLVPIMVDEVLPGDSMRLKMTAFGRVSTFIVPPMDNLILESFFFFVPMRLLWSNTERFFGEQTSPTDTTSFLMPKVTLAPADVAQHTLADYMGLTMSGAVAGTISVNALPFRAYNLIWNEWFRPQDITVKRPENMGDGPDNIADYVLCNRQKRHDYFSTCLPWPEKPLNVDVTPGFTPLVPGGGFQLRGPGTTGVINQIGAPVTGIGVTTPPSTNAGAALKMPGGRTVTPAEMYNTSIVRLTASHAGATGYPDVKVLVNDLRMSMMMQAYMERNARSGTRYGEKIFKAFGVRNPDARIQRPEYLGGGRSHITVHPLAQTSPTEVDGTYLGEQAGIGTVGVYDHGFSQSFTEHGYILGLVNVRADLAYQQGIEKLWFRNTMLDFYDPAFAHLGEGAVLSKEIYSDGTAGDDSIFGYQERWAEYKYRSSRTAGLFRSTVATPLDVWHYALEFASRPVLNTIFLDDTPPVQRNIQVAQNHGAQFLMDMRFDRRATRCMPMYSIPGIGGRF